jgi:hypothetical protein
MEGQALLEQRWIQQQLPLPLLKTALVATRHVLHLEPGPDV